MAIWDGTGRYGRLMPLGMRVGKTVANEAEEKARTEMGMPTWEGVRHALSKATPEQRAWFLRAMHGGGYGPNKTQVVNHEAVYQEAARLRDAALDEQACDMGVSAAESIDLVDLVSLTLKADGMTISIPQARVCAMPDDVNSHGGDAFPLWDPAKHVVGAPKPTAGQALGEAVAASRRERKERLAIESMMVIAQEIAAIGEGMAHAASEYARAMPDTLLGPASADWVQPAEEPEGERLARFFATSAHEGHEAVRHERPVVPRPDDKLLDYAGSVCAVTYCHADAFVPFATVTIDGGWACTVYGHDVKPDVARRCAWLQPVIAETQGTLRAWEAAMRAGQ